MGIFKRVINIIHADINSILEKLEARQPREKQNSYRTNNSWQNSQNENRNSSNNTNNNNFHDEKLSRYYANLEIPYGSDLETVKKAWKKLIRKYHPDLHSNDQLKVKVATQLTSKLNEAYKEIEKSLISKKNRT